MANIYTKLLIYDCCQRSTNSDIKTNLLTYSEIKSLHKFSNNCIDEIDEAREDFESRRLAELENIKFISYTPRRNDP